MSKVVEIRGRGSKWTVHYPDEAGFAHDVPIYDRDGKLKGSVSVGTDAGGWTEAHFIGTREEAEEYAEFLVPGAEIKFVRSATPHERAIKAAATRRRNREAAED